MASKSFSSAAAILILHAARTAAAPVNQAGTATLAAAAPPATFTANPNVGPGGSTFTDSAHFRVYGATGSQATESLNMLEGAYDCYVNTLGWRSTGLSYNSANDDGPFYKVNLYSVASLPGAAGVMHSDATTGLAWLEVQQDYITVPGVVVHEWGHGITYTERYWVDQGRTGAWWETVANWIADTYKTSSLCASARSSHGQSATDTEINLQKVIGDSYQVIVDGSANTGNYYEAWPFLAYLTSNPDGYAGLGQTAVRDMIRQYSQGSNETPLHALDRIATSNTAQQIVARYWARMAYVDIGHATAQQVFLQQRSSINYANLDSQGSGTYKVKSARQPRYMGASIIPLTKSGSATVTAQVTASQAFTATLAVRNTSSGVTRYVDLASGSGSTTVSSSEEASLVVVNTPASLILFDPFSLTSDVQAGLDYTVTLTGATA
ncbi:putative dockerin type 1 [Rosellinia necatrix]|uniref:Putative dockerin type 1 n=1 Tax=Rosellinia necatrix TaxID=77044 RepID=A0A1W2TT50_ROSNE|nr:putative dockerin type 1 [Rosellinia necatrix]